MLEPTRPRETQDERLARYALWSRLRVEQRCNKIRDQQLSDLPDSIAEYLSGEWNQRAETLGYPSANEWITAQSRALRAAHIHQAFDNEAVRAASQRLARRISKCTNVRAATRCIEGYGLKPPQGRRVTADSAMRRMRDPRWLRRRLRRAWSTQCESLKRELGMIHRKRAPYCSNAVVKYRAAQQKASKEWLKHCVAVNSAGERFSLYEIHQRSLANPALRRAEFMTRVHGFEDIAHLHRHGSDFWTLTCPSAYHRKLETGADNPRFEGFTPKQGQEWLCKMWQRARAKFKRLNLLCYGVRIAEPHHDGTPHWHMLIFAPVKDIQQIRSILQTYWLSDYGAEPGAERYRTKYIPIDSSKGSATGYVAKYLSKNIDAAGSIGGEQDFDSEQSICESTTRVCAWAATHGIRQFQQLGGPCIGLWRELRRLREPVKDPDIEMARSCADRGQFAKFILCVGGIAAGRRTNLQIHKEETGKTNYYGEPRDARLVGVRWASAIQITRPEDWRLEFDAVLASDSGSASDLGPVAITVRTDFSDQMPPGAPAGWTNPQETSMYGPRLDS
jgi:hypothetical protein